MAIVANSDDEEIDEETDEESDDENDEDSEFSGIEDM